MKDGNGPDGASLQPPRQNGKARPLATMAEPVAAS